MLVQNTGYQWIVVLCLVLIASGFAIAGTLDPSFLDRRAATTDCTEAGQIDGLPVVGTGQKPAAAPLSWEWIVIAALVGVVIGMTVGITLSRQPIIHS